jgi:hypothetical protein
MTGKMNYFFKEGIRNLPAEYVQPMIQSNCSHWQPSAEKKLYNYLFWEGIGDLIFTC